MRGKDKALSQERIWTMAFAAICITQLCTCMAQSMFNNGFAIYINALGRDTLFSGLGAAAFAASATVSRLLSGRVVDQYGSGIVMGLGGALFAVSTAAFCLFQSPFAILFLRFLQGMGYSFLSTASATAASASLPSSRLGEGTGYFGLGNSIGTAIGPSIVLALIATGLYFRMFLSIALVILVGTACALISHPPKPVPASVSPPGAPSGMALQSILEPHALIPGVIMFLSSAAFSSSQTFLTLFASINHIPHGGLYFTAAAASIFLTRLLNGKVFDRKGPVAAILPGCGAGILSYLILASGPNFAAYLFSGVCYGICNGVALPTLSAVSVRHSAPARRGVALSTVYLFMDLGMGIGGAFWGKIQTLFGFDVVFLGAAGCILTAALLCVLCFRQEGAQQQGTKL